MADPTKYTRDYSFTDYQAATPSAPLPAPRVDDELDNVAASVGQTIDALKDVRRSDGKLKNKIVTPDSLSDNTKALLSGGAISAWAPLVAFEAGIVATPDAPATLVRYDGSTWVCAEAHTTSGVFDDTKWELVAEKGEDGTPAPTGALLASNNLSDVANAATARTNLGLGTAATQASSAFVAATAVGAANGVAPLGSDGKVPSSYLGAVGVTDGDKGDITVSGSGATWSVRSGEIIAARYGAVADGTTDTAAAIQSAINAAAAAGGGTVRLGPGVHIVGTTLVLPSNVTLAGRGIDVTTLKLKNSAGATAVITTTDTATLWGTSSEDGAQYWGVKDLTIDGNRANNTTGHGVYTYSRAYLLERIKIVNCADNGVRSGWGDGAAWSDSDAVQYDPFMEAAWTDFYIGYCGKEGIYFDGPHDSRWVSGLVALNGQSATGAYDGIYLGPNAGGTSGVAVHSWGDTQRRAWQVNAGYTYWTGCIADDAYEALVLVAAPVFSWVGGHAFGAVFGTPTAQDEVLKGFVIGVSGTLVGGVHIDTEITNCPGGAVDFTYADTASQGRVRVNGSIQSNLQTATTGLQTYGFVGSIPTTWSADIVILGVGNSYAIGKSVGTLEMSESGSASFPALRTRSDPNTGLYFPGADKVALAAGGVAVVTANGDGSVLFGTRSGTPTATWVAGLVYFDTSTSKLRVYTGTAWVDLH